MKFTIIQMQCCHVAAIAALERLYFSSPWVEEAVASELENPLSLWLVAMDGERLIGYIGSQSVLGESDMMNVAVHPDYRCQGVGSALVMALMDALKPENRCLSLEVRASNEVAKAMYARLGFLEVGRRPCYYTKPTEDALILRKEW